MARYAQGLQAGGTPELGRLNQLSCLHCPHRPLFSLHGGAAQSRPSCLLCTQLALGMSTRQGSPRLAAKQLTAEQQTQQKGTSMQCQQDDIKQLQTGFGHPAEHLPQ